MTTPSHDVRCWLFNRYFSKQELYELFHLDNTRHSSTQTQLLELQRGQRKTDTSLDEHIAFLHTLGQSQETFASALYKASSGIRQ